METKTDAAAIVWSWHYGTLSADVVTVDQLPSAAYHMMWSDDCSVMGVETSDGFVDRDDYAKTDEYRKYEREQDERYRQSLSKAKAANTHAVEVQEPRDGGWWHHMSGPEAKAHDEADKLASVVGRHRVRVRML